MPLWRRNVDSSLVRRYVDHAQEREWPLAVPLACAVIAGTTLVVAAFQNRPGFGISHDIDRPPWIPDYSLGVGLLAATLAFLPFLLDVLAHLARRPEGFVPLWLFPVPVVLGVAYFIAHPADYDFAPFVLVFMTGEIVSRSVERLGPAIWTATVSVAILVVTEILGLFNGTFIWVIGISFGFLGGFLIRELDKKTHELEEAQAGLAEKAAADERSRIAREVHDVIAHSLSVTMLHVTAARMALERGHQTAEALEALREAEQQGRKSFTEIRRTVGLLGGDETAKAPPMPSVADLPRLVTDFRSAGMDVSLQMNGDVLALPPAAGLTLYRIVQESLTNVVKHAPGAKAWVELTLTDSDIRLRVHNVNGNGARPTDGESGGLGIRGMIERATVLDGTLGAGPDAGGWTVFLHAPRPAEATT